MLKLGIGGHVLKSRAGRQEVQLEGHAERLGLVGFWGNCEVFFLGVVDLPGRVRRMNDNQHLERLAVATALYLARMEYGRLRALPQPFETEIAERQAFGVATYYMQRAGFRSGLNVDEQEELRAMLRVVD